MSRFLRKGRGGEDMADRAAQALIGAHCTDKARNGALDFAVVKDDGIGSVAGHGTFKVICRIGGVKDIGGDVAGLKRNAQLISDDGIELIPGDGFIAGDMIRLTDGMNIAHQTDKAFGEVGVVRDRPQRGAVAMEQDGLAVEHAAENLPATLFAISAQRQIAFVIGMAGTDDGHRETIFPVLLHQVFFAGDFVAGILPIRIMQRSALGDEIIGAGLLISGGGGNIDRINSRISKTSAIDTFCDKPNLQKTYTPQGKIRGKKGGG